MATRRWIPPCPSRLPRPPSWAAPPPPRRPVASRRAARGSGAALAGRVSDLLPGCRRSASWRSIRTSNHGSSCCRPRGRRSRWGPRVLPRPRFRTRRTGGTEAGGVGEGVGGVGVGGGGGENHGERFELEQSTPPQPPAPEPPPPEPDDDGGGGGGGGGGESFWSKVKRGLTGGT